MLGLFNQGSGALMFVNAVGGLLHMALEVALLVVALTVVRRHRPDAVLLFAIAPTLSLLNAVFTSVVTVVATRVVGYEHTMDVYAAVGVGSSLLGGASTVCFLLGIVRLAKPPAVGYGAPIV